MSDVLHFLVNPDLPGQRIKVAAISVERWLNRGWRHECCDPNPDETDQSTNVTDTPVNAPAEPVNPEPAPADLDPQKEK